MIKYRTQSFYNSGGEIIAVEVLRETDGCVYLPLSGQWNGTKKTEQRQAKVTDWCRYHDTWEEARAYLMSRARTKLEDARLRVVEAERVQRLVAAMCKPEIGAGERR